MQLTLEILRAAMADDPFAFRVGLQEYVLRTPLGGVETAALVWDDELLAELQVLRRPGRDPELVQRIGDRLRGFLSTTSFAQREAEVLAALARGEAVQVTLRLAAAELYALPWELLTLQPSGRHLGELPGVLLRYAWPETVTAPEVPAPRPEGGRILVAWSAAAGAVPAREHVQAIERACRRGHHRFDLGRDVLPGVTLERLAAELGSGDEPIAVLHLLCHGARSQSGFGLALHAAPTASSRSGSYSGARSISYSGVRPISTHLGSTRSGSTRSGSYSGLRSGSYGAVRGDGDGGDEGVHVVDAGQLRQLLGPHAGRLRLVVLCACDSANSGQLGSHLGSVAQALHRAGLAAVVASRYPLSSAGSIELTEALYDTLLGPPAALETALLAARQRLRLRSGSLDWASLQLYARPEDGDDTRPLVVRPYRGLSPFLMSHRRFFFGREREQRLLRAALDKLREAGQPRLVIVAGASGSGKSSLVLGGLIPELIGELSGEAVPAGASRAREARRVLAELSLLLGARGVTGPLKEALATLHGEVAALPEHGSGAWEWAVLRPGDDPLGALDRALRARLDPTRPFLLCIDQLEELFTHGPAQSPARGEFVRRLWTLAREPPPGAVHLVLTLRVDFLGRLSELTLDESGLRLDRIAYTEAHSLFVAQMAPSQLAAAIEGPARRVGLVLPPALVPQMVRDVEGEPGALPLLEYVLDLLWQGREGRTLSEQAYAALGGVGGALGNSAERVLLGLLPADQTLARRLLTRLVSFSEGGGETRRRVALRRLREQLPPVDGPGGEGAGDRLDVVIDAFVAARLLVRGEEQGEGTVEVAHEALIRKWPRLRTWLAEDRQRLEELRELEQWAAQHAAYGTVLRGAQLGYAQRLLDKYPGELGPAVTALVRDSVRAKRRRRRQLSAALLVVIAALSALTLYARRSQEQALRERAAALHKERVASSRLLGIQAERALGPRPDQALLLAARSLALHAELASRSVLLQALERSRLIQRFLRGPRGRVYAVAFSPDGHTLAAASEDGLWLYDADRGALRAHLTEAAGEAAGAARDGALHAVAFSPDGLQVAAAGSRGRVRLWDTTNLQRPAEPLQAAARTLYSLDFSRGGELLAAGTEDGRVLLWDVARRQALPPIVAGSGQLISALSFAATGGGSRLAVAGSQGGVSVFDPASGQRLLGPLATDKGYISGLAWSPDGGRLAGASEDRSVLLWGGLAGGGGGGPGGPGGPQVLAGHDSAVSGVSFSPDGRALASCGLDHTLVLWDAEKGQAAGDPLRAADEAIYSCAFSPDGQRLASGGDGQIVIWDVSDHPLRRRQRRPLGLSALAVDPSGRRAVLGTPEGSLRLWELSRPEPGPPVPVHGQGVNTLAFDASGARVLSGGSDGEARVLQAETLALQARLLGPPHGSVLAVAWSPGGETAAVGYADGALALFGRGGAPQRPPIASRQQSITQLLFLGEQALLSSGLDGSLRLWRPSDGALRCSVASAHGDGVTALAGSPDGRTLATAGRDRRVLLWRTAADGCPVSAGELPGPGPGRDGAVTTLGFSLDGALLAAGGEDAAVQLWDVAARQPIGGPLRGHLRPLVALAFARDQALLTADDEGLRRWDLLESAWPARACARVNRNLTLSEWPLFFGDTPYCRICAELPGELPAERSGDLGAGAAPPCL